MNDKMFEEVLKRLDNLVALLGDGAVKIWPLLIRQVYVSFYFYLGVACITALSTYCFIRGYYAAKYKDEFKENLYGLLSIITCIGCIISILFTGRAVLDLMNLELSALSNLSTMLRSVR